MRRIRLLATAAGSGGGPLTNGKQLISQLAGLSTNVGPNALLQSSSYPLPTSSSSGPLTVATLPSGFSYWRINSTPGSGQFNIPNQWQSGASTPYVYNNDPANLGGIVPAGGMTIDGYVVAAGTYVFQFFDMSLGTFYLQSGGPSVLFRGCRIRSSQTSPGFFNAQSGGYNSYFAAHYCDLGGPGDTSLTYLNEIAVQVAQCSNLRLLRNYISCTGSGFIPGNGGGTLDVIENYIEKITMFDPSYHDNGIKPQGGNPNFRILRNKVIFSKFDGLGNQLTQTDAIGMIPSFGAFSGTGTNSDGSTGYVIDNNYVAGAGYCFYLGSNNINSAVSNLVFTNNLVSTSSYSTGGFFGATAYPPPSGWGTNGNFQSNNTWADGPNVGQSVI